MCWSKIPVIRIKDETNVNIAEKVELELGVFRIKMNYEMLSKMSVRELNNYLQVRGLNVSGKKEELIARVFVAVDNNVQPIKTTVEVDGDLALCYRNKLNVDGKNIPYPIKIMHGCKDEYEGVIFWPMVTFPDIFTYLMFFPTELGSTDLSDYKLCKAYSYFKNGLLEPLKSHTFSRIKFCLIKTIHLISCGFCWKRHAK